MPIYTFYNSKTKKTYDEMMSIGFNEVLSKVAEAHPKSALAKEHRKRTIKEVQTDNVIKKHRARQKSKNK